MSVGFNSNSENTLMRAETQDSTLVNVQGADPLVDDDLATKRYVDSHVPEDVVTNETLESKLSEITGTNGFTKVSSQNKEFTPEDFSDETDKNWAYTPAFTLDGLTDEDFAPENVYFYHLVLDSTDSGFVFEIEYSDGSHDTFPESDEVARHVLETGVVHWSTTSLKNTKFRILKNHKTFSMLALQFYVLKPGKVINTSDSYSALKEQLDTLSNQYNLLNESLQELISSGTEKLSERVTALENAGYQTRAQVDSAISEKGYQTASDVESAITDKGYQTASDVESAITEKGYQTASEVESAITGKGYQTADDVESAITDKGYQTASDVESAITNKGYQTASDVESAIRDKGYQTASDVESAISGKGYQTAPQVEATIAGKGYQTALDVNNTLELKNYLSAIYANKVYVKKAGDTMTGALNLPSPPTADSNGATKEYLDSKAEEIKALIG